MSEAEITPKKSKPEKEVFRQIGSDEIVNHVFAARMLIPLAVPQEAAFLRAFADKMEGKRYIPSDGDDLKIIKRGIGAAESHMPVTTSLRDLQIYLAGRHRGSGPISEATKKRLTDQSKGTRKRRSNSRPIRQPLTVSPSEMDFVKQAVEKSGYTMSEFVRTAVSNVCSGQTPFIVPPVVYSRDRNKQESVRWSEAEWNAVGLKAIACYGPTTGKRGHSGTLIRDVVLSHAKMVLEGH